MNDTALVTFFGTVIEASNGSYRGTVLEYRDQKFVQADSTRQGLVNAPACLTLHHVKPRVYRLHDGDGVPISHAPDGSRDLTMERATWSELSCLNLKRFPDVARAIDERSDIPRVIHFICDDPATLHPAFRDNIRKTAEMNRGWTVKLWGESERYEFISEHYGWDLLKIYLMIGKNYGAGKADFFRYLLIYKFGGVYLDLKSTTQRPLDSFLDKNDQFLLSQWNMSGTGKHAGWGLGASIAHVPGGEYQQWFLIARPGHAFLRRTIQLVMTKILTYRPEVHGAGAVTTFNITGPHAYTQAIHDIRDLYPHRHFDSESDGLVYSVVDNHRDKGSSDYRKAITPMITGNESYLI